MLSCNYVEKTNEMSFPSRLHHLKNTIDIDNMNVERVLFDKYLVITIDHIRIW